MDNKSKKEEKQEQALVPVKQDAEALIAKAIEKNVSVETMERLLVMRRELKAEYAKEQFDNAMAKFQAKCPTIRKTKEVKTRAGVVAYRYAPLESIVEQVKELLKTHGFSYAVQTETLNGSVKAICIVKHRFGHSDQSSITVPLGNKTDIMSQTQVVAAALTFAKRYAFCNAFGILTGDEDTDASPETAEHGNQPVVYAGNQQRNGNGHITLKQAWLIKGLLKEKGFTEQDLMRKYKVTGISQLASTQASQIIENLQRLPDIDAKDRESEAIANAVAAGLS